MRGQSWTVVAGGIVVIAILAGCAASPTAEPSSAGSGSADPVSSPSAEPTRPDLADLTVGLDGLGPIGVGAPVPSESPETAVAVFQDDYCLARGAVGDPYVGLWVPNYPEDEPADGSLGPFTLLTSGGVQTGAVSGIWIESPKISTETGVHVGSTTAELTAAYPTFDRISPTVVTDAYIIDRPPVRLQFEVARDAGFWSADDIGTVRAIEVLPSSAALVSLFEGDGPVGCGD